MKSCDMVIVVPVDKHTGNDEVLRLQAWGEVSELLRPGLGKLYRQFNPSGSAWERKYPRPFGVVLGWQEPEVFRELLKAGEEAQHEAVAFHLEAMLRKADLGSAQKIGDTQVYSAVVDGSDPELLAHGVWHILMQKGTPVPDCGIYYAAHYVCPGIGRMAVNDELSALHNHTNFGKDTRRAFLFAGPSYGCILEELKARGKKSEGKLIRYSEAYRELHYPIHLLSCDETGARQLQIMAVPYYREKLARLMLRSAYQPPPEDAPAWDGLYNGHPFVIGADMELRRIDAAIRMARERNCLPIALAALDAQGSAVLLARYADPGYATVYKVTDGVLTKLFGHAPALYEPPCTQFLTKKGDVVNAPLIKALGKDRGPRCK